MRPFIVLLALTIASISTALNLAPIATHNLRRIEDGLRYAKANDIPYVRFNDAMAEATKTAELDVSAHVEAGKLAKRYGRQVVFISYIQIPNSKYWRAKYVSASSSGASDSHGRDRDQFERWKSDEARGFYQDLKNPRGIYPELWGPAVEASEKMYQAFCRGYGSGVIRQLDNEPGNVLDARLTQDLAYGAVSRPIRDFFAYWIPKASGDLCAPSWETQSMEGLFHQLEAEDKRHWGRFKYQAVNWYLTRWRAGDTPEKWAQRCASEIDSFIKNQWWPNRDVVLSELGAIGAPPEMREFCLASFMRVKPDKVKIVAWFDYDSKEWGLKGSSAPNKQTRRLNKGLSHSTRKSLLQMP